MRSSDRPALHPGLREGQNHPHPQQPRRNGDQSTCITNKYFEDTKSDTVANKFSNLIIALESVEKNDNTIVDPDPEHKEFIEDEYFNSSDEEEEIGFFSEIECSEEETEVLDYMKSIHCESKESLVQLYRTWDQTAQLHIKHCVTAILN